MKKEERYICIDSVHEIMLVINWWVITFFWSWSSKEEAQIIAYKKLDEFILSLRDGEFNKVDSKDFYAHRSLEYPIHYIDWELHRFYVK